MLELLYEYINLRSRARMANLVADLNTENPPYLCGFRKIASEAPFHRTFSTNMRARSSWQSPGVGKLNTKTTGQTKGPEVRRVRPPEAVRPGGGRAGGALARLVCPVVLVFNFPTPGLCHEDLARIFVLKVL